MKARTTPHTPGTERFDSKLSINDGFGYVKVLGMNVMPASPVNALQLQRSSSMLPERTVCESTECGYMREHNRQESTNVLPILGERGS